MKRCFKTDEITRAYVAPEAYLVEIPIERGFADSTEDAEKEDETSFYIY